MLDQRRHRYGNLRVVAEPFEIEIGGAVLTGLEQGEGLPVVFLHAGVCDKRMWLSQM